MAEERTFQDSGEESRVARIIRWAVFAVCGGGILIAVIMAAYRKLAG